MIFASSQSRLLPRQRVSRARLLSWSATLGLATSYLVFPSGTLWVLVLLLATLGIGHGAVDHLLVRRCTEFRRFSLTKIIAAYIGLAMAGFILYLVDPALGFFCFLGLSVWHFGCADYRLASDHYNGTRAIAEILLRGATPLLFGSILRISPLLLPSLAVFTTLILTTWALRLRSTGDTIDVILPAIIVSVLPFGIGFAVYFVGWHALRHSMWVQNFAAPITTAQSQSPHITIPLLQFVPFTLVGTIYIVVGALISSHYAISPIEFVLASIFAVTIPHELVVSIMRRETLRPQLDRYAGNGSIL